MRVEGQVVHPSADSREGDRQPRLNESHVYDDENIIFWEVTRLWEGCEMRKKVKVEGELIDLGVKLLMEESNEKDASVVNEETFEQGSRLERGEGLR